MNSTELGNPVRFVINNLENDKYRFILEAFNFQTYMLIIVHYVNHIIVPPLLAHCSDTIYLIHVLCQLLDYQLEGEILVEITKLLSGEDRSLRYLATEILLKYDNHHEKDADWTEDVALISDEEIEERKSLRFRDRDKWDFEKFGKMFK